jgi:N-acetyl-1-D-myo-inositol-2-amino-2-deoxy-alpha-D-glucopyranoside deacetylase
MAPDARGGVLFVHAHPDDESMSTGGSIARLVAEGRRVDLVTCTDGAEGEIHDPTLDPSEAHPRLAAIRAAELACSVQALGNGSVHQHLLGYRDSGMMGTDANGHPESFWQADVGAATRRLVAVVRDARPAAIVSYDENGNYGHPDHINAARIAREAYLASQGTEWAVSRFHEVAFHRDAWIGLMRDMKERGIALPWDMDSAVDALPADELNPTNAAALAQVGESLDDDASPSWEEDFGRPDEAITTRFDVSAHLDAKRRSMDCHKTQRQDLGWLLDLPPDLADRAMSTEYFVLRWLDGEDVPATHREDHLLAP